MRVYKKGRAQADTSVMGSFTVTAQNRSKLSIDFEIYNRT